MAYFDSEYHRDRVTAELELAKASECAKAASVHRELARQYQQLIDLGERPALGMVRSA